MTLGFTFGAFGPLAIRREKVDLGLGHGLRLLYASDLHLGHWWTTGVPDQLETAAWKTGPDLILLGGDLIDRSSAFPSLADCVHKLSRAAPVLAIAGNHDARCGVEQVADAVVSAGGQWLPSTPWIGPVVIDGILQKSPRGYAGTRILCAHYPSIFPAAVQAGYDLVLAGHLHGGQCVLANRSGNLYPAAWISRWHALRFQDRKAVMLVSRGAADTLPIRFNCPREVICCDLH